MDEVLVLDKGRIEFRGYPEDLKRRGEFSKFIKETSITHEEEDYQVKEGF